MKKLLRKVSLFAIAIFVSCLLVGNANAETRYGSVHGNVTASGSYKTSTRTSKWSDTSKTFGDYGQIPLRYSNGHAVQFYGSAKFYRHTENGTGLPFYCLDANLNGFGDGLYATRFLLGDYEDNVYSYDLAVMHVLTSDASYAVKSVVIRTLTAVWGHTRYNSSATGATMAIYRSYFGLAHEWITGDSGIRASYDTIYNAWGDATVISSLSKLQSHSDYSIDLGTTRDQARTLFAGALAEAADYLDQEERARVSEEVSSASSISTTRTEVDAGVRVTYNVTKTFTLNNFSNDGSASFIIDRLAYDKTLDELGADAQPTIIAVYINGTDYTSNFNGNFINQNLLAPISGSIGETVTIDVTIQFTGYEDVTDFFENVYPELKCGQQPMAYTMHYTYSDSNMSSSANSYSGYLGIVWEAYGVAQIEGYRTDLTQRFVSLETTTDGSGGSSITPNTGEGTSTGTVMLTDACSCDDLIDACVETGNMASTECQDLLDADCGECAELEVECAFGDEDACTQFNNTCEVSCETTVDTFNCCDANNELIVSTLDNHEVSVLGPENYTACFVNQIDGHRDPNTGYNTTEGAKDDVDNSYTMQQNKYCVVSCKEDYIMTMPTAKLVNAGRYFTFSAAVDGTKTCYTNTIDRDLYNEDIEEAQLEMVDALNNYKYWEAAYEAVINDPQSVTSNCAACEGDGPSYIVYHYVQTEAEQYEFTALGNGLGRVDLLRETQNVYEQSTISNTCVGSSTCTSCSEDGECSSWTITGVTPTSRDTLGNLTNNIRNSLDEAEQRLQDAQHNYQDIISAYNDCSNWETEINYDPEVYYDYEEDYITDFYNNYGDMNESLSEKNTNAWYCNSSVASNGAVNGNASINNAYDACSDGSTTTNTTYTTFNYVYCDEDGCSTDKELSTQQISNAKYKKITSTIEANYKPETLFYNVYPSGEIVDAEEGEGRDDTVALENKLPVALDTERGIYKYTLNIKNLGEYYNTDDSNKYGELGRLIGDNTNENAVINAEDYGEFVDENGFVQYACSYLVNMGYTDDTHIYCDFNTTCTGEECYADCIGPNCYYDEDKCEGEDCVADCIGAGCIYDSNAGSSLLERVVSLNNLFPNGTDSYNWDRDKNTKAQVTIDEIEDAGDTVYEEDPILSVTITPEARRQITAYNDSAEGSGGYSNQTLVCYDLNNYQEVACYSTFITDLINGIYANDIVNNRSLIMGNNYRTVNNNNFNYFTLWSGSGISEDDMIGPSWK